MTEEEFHSQPETEGEQSEGEPLPKKSDEEIKAERVASLAGQQQAKEAEKAAVSEDRQGQIEVFIIDNDLLDNEAVFGAEPLNPEVMTAATNLLLEAENKIRRADPQFQLDEVWSKDVAKDYLERKYTKEDKSELDTGYKTAVQEIRENNPDITNVELCQALLNTPDKIPPSEIAKLQTFVQIQELAATPEDAAIVMAKINAQDFSGGIPNPVLFVEAEIFADDSLSDSYKEAVAAKFNIPNPRIKTGGQVNQTLDARDPDGKPLYTQEHPVEIGDNTHAYENPDGSRAVLVDIGDGRKREIPWNRNEADDIIGTKISLVKIWAMNEWSGQTDFFGESVDIENDILSQTDPQKLSKVRNTINSIFGGTRGFDAVIIQDNEAAFVGWFNQYLATKGDAAIGDFDKEAAFENRNNIGLHPNGDPNQIDQDVLRAAALYAKGQYGSGEPNYYALQRHLHEMFPEKNIPLTGENTPEGNKQL